MSNETIRNNLVDSINELNHLLEVCQDSDQKFAIRMKTRELFQCLDKVIAATLDSSTQEFNDAIESLQVLTSEAKEAKADLNKIAETVKRAEDALGKVETLVKNVAGGISAIT